MFFSVDCMGNHLGGDFFEWTVPDWPLNCENFFFVATEFEFILLELTGRISCLIGNIFTAVILFYKRKKKEFSIQHWVCVREGRYYNVSYLPGLKFSVLGIKYCTEFSNLTPWFNIYTFQIIRCENYSSKMLFVRN